MQGFLQTSARRNYSTALQFIRNAHELLEWGRKLWKDIPREERGTIFDNTFFIGVKRLLMSTLMAVYWFICGVFLGSCQM
jgi:hypothetical protein